MEFNDVRFEFISEYTLKSMKLKADKWAKLQGNDEYRQTILDFFEKQEYNILIIFQNNAGQLQPSFDFPTSMKAKAVYFSKKEKGMNVGKDNFKTALTYGDLSYSPLEQLSALVDEVCFANLACFNKCWLSPGENEIYNEIYNTEQTSRTNTPIPGEVLKFLSFYCVKIQC